jgi:acetyltransferase-like isoleucine patch superfamily enzyme
MLMNLTGYIPVRWFRTMVYRRAFGMKIGKDSVVFRGLKIWMPWRVKMGHHSLIGERCVLDGRRGIEIGNNVNISGEVRIFTLQHDMDSETFASTGGKVTIGDFAYIGTNATLLPGVVIGEGSVVGACSVVTKSVEPWTFVAGVPAKPVRSRPIMNYQLDTLGSPGFQ